MRRLLKADDVAELLTISRRSAYRVIKQCVHVRVPGGIRVTEEALEQYLAERTVKPLPLQSWSPPRREVKPRLIKGYEAPAWVRPIKPGRPRRRR